MDYVLIKSDKNGIQEVLLGGSKDKLEKARELLLNKINSRNYSVSYKLTIWKVKGNV